MAPPPPPPSDKAARVKKLRDLAELLDACFRIPGTRIRFGLDGLLGLVPVAGDVITAGLALHIVSQARRLGAPERLVHQMLLNVGADFLAGLFPVAGDLVDIAWKANLKNIKLLEDWLGQEEDIKGTDPIIDV